METSVISALLGIFYLACLFALSVGTVVIVKVVFYRFFPKKSEVKAEKKPARRPRKKVNRIVIDPDEINRILVKKEKD